MTTLADLPPGGNTIGGPYDLEFTGSITIFDDTSDDTNLCVTCENNGDFIFHIDSDGCTVDFDDAVLPGETETICALSCNTVRVESCTGGGEECEAICQIDKK